VTIKIWHLGIVLSAALLTIAVFVGYSLAPKPSGAEARALSQQLAQKDQLIATLQTQIATNAQRQSVESPIAADAYKAFQDRVNKSAVQANVRAVLPDVESYNADNVPGAPTATDPDAATSNADSGYAGMTADELLVTYDQAFPANTWANASDPGFPQSVTGITPTPTNYCVVSQVADWYSWKVGPGGMIQVTQNPAVVCAT
jgi:hypothetical protein